MALAQRGHLRRSPGAVWLILAVVPMPGGRGVSGWRKDQRFPANPSGQGRLTLRQSAPERTHAAEHADLAAGRRIARGLAAPAISPRQRPGGAASCDERERREDAM
jgi:hypothetical protein